ESMVYVMKQKMVKGAVVAVIMSVSMCGASPSPAPENSRPPNRDLYGSVSSEEYLTGQFEPASHESFVSLSKTGIPANGSHYLRKEAAAALSRMLDDFKKEHPAIRIYVQSSTRNFSAQRTIWNAKWRGERPVGGMNLAREMKDPYARAAAILKYSSMPGTSRHHWGTDFDINTLTNDYYEKGEGKVIFDWLTANASRYGFARPFNAGRDRGYEEEKWHWSYTPLSRYFLADWLSRFGEDGKFFTRRGLFEGSEAAGVRAAEYVEAVNPECR
ncbi:MAG: M15 family metallopeptidase, partial [Spirochaetota bacterium]